jgi:hypothetical protein
VAANDLIGINLVEQRFSNTVQHYPFQHWKLLDDPLDFGQREVLGRFKRLKGADTRLAFRIAAIRGFEI